MRILKTEHADIAFPTQSAFVIFDAHRLHGVNKVIAKIDSLSEEVIFESHSREERDSFRMKLIAWLLDEQSPEQITVKELMRRH